MTRSHSVWLVCDPTGRPQAAFTVKHEMVTWLLGDAPDQIDDLHGWTVYQLRDNPQLHQVPVEISIEGLMS